MARVEMEVVAVSREPHSHEAAYALILDERAGQRRLKIIIAQPEAQVIAMELEKYTFRRPLTHDLLVSILHAMKAKVLELTIYKLEDNTFFAYLTLETPTQQVVDMDCRPSDGVAIALKTQAPIYCEEEVLDLAGIPIQDSDEETEEEVKKSPSLLTKIPTRGSETSKEASILQTIIDSLLRSSPKELDALIAKLRALPHERKEELIGILQGILDEAIQQEKYEMAARLRDIIQRMEQG
jgi:bifunctional DNase/RNase